MCSGNVVEKRINILTMEDSFMIVWVEYCVHSIHIYMQKTLKGVQQNNKESQNSCVMKKNFERVSLYIFFFFEENPLKS